MFIAILASIALLTDTYFILLNILSIIDIIALLSIISSITFESLLAIDRQVILVIELSILLLILKKLD